jgi:hypothetical protein
MTLENAVNICLGAGLTGWELVGFAQRIVNQNMKYSVDNSLDSPQEAFKKGRGYCWHQASVLNMILLKLGFTAALSMHSGISSRRLRWRVSSSRTSFPAMCGAGLE